MKRHFLTGLKAFAVGALAFAAVSCYDDQPIWDEIEGLKDRVTALEEKLNTEVATINTTLGTLKAADEKLVDKIVGDRCDEIWCEDCTEEFFAAVKTAAVVEEWASEISEEMISERFGVGGGDIHAAVENLKWLLHAAKRIAHEFAPSLEKEMSILEMRVANGVKEELIPLISLKGIGRVRARRLFSRGITNPAELLAADKADLISVLGSVTTENVLKEAKRKGGVKTERDEELDEVMEKKEEVLEQTKTDTKKQPTLFDF